MGCEYFRHDIAWDRFEICTDIIDSANKFTLSIPNFLIFAEVVEYEIAQMFDSVFSM